VHREQRRQVMLDVVLAREFQNRVTGAQAEPDHRAFRHLVRPGHFIDEPRCPDARQIGRRGAVDVERRGGMPLEERCRDLQVNFALDRAPDDCCLVLSGGEDDDLAGTEDGRDTHRGGFTWNVFLAEEIGGSVPPRDRVERDEPGAAVRTRTRLVEADVSRLADTEQLEVDATRANDGFLV
jgi:hypothetical protein